ncbi:MAG: radical SAM protein [Candidatus Peregrinibacteria bacterium]
MLERLPDKTREDIRTFNEEASARGLRPVKVPPFYEQKVLEEMDELGETGGPLYKAILPSEDRFRIRAPGEVPDFVDDRENMPDLAPHTIVRKYRNRLLFFPTDVCSGHCQYCFRTDVLTEQHDKKLPTLEEKLDQVIAYLSEHPEIEEVILSGGDPMILPPHQLEEVLKRLKGDAKVANIRIHTRTLAFSPQVFNDRNCKALADANVRLVHHIIHPYEICDEVRSKIDTLNGLGVRSYNQFPVLSGINDHVEVLKRLLTELDNLGIRNLSMFIPDPINYSSGYRMTLERFFRLMDELNWTTSSWVNSTRLVLDTVHGKVRREDLKSIDKTTGIATFEREGKTIKYPDLPEHLDKSSDIKTLLWKS